MDQIGQLLLFFFFKLNIFGDPNTENFRHKNLKNPNNLLFRKKLT